MPDKMSAPVVEGGGTRVIITGSSPSTTWIGKRTKLEGLLMVMIASLTMVVLILVVVLAIKSVSDIDDPTNPSLAYNMLSSKSKEGNYGNGETSFGEKRKTPSIYNAASQTIATEEGEAEICLTSTCVKAAARLMNAMDDSVDPCENFFDYACGNWNKVNVIPDDRSLYNTFGRLRDDLQVMVRDLLDKPPSDKDSAAMKKAKYLYVSCTNEDLIDKRGLKPIINLLTELGSWPAVAGDAWNEEEFDLIELIMKLRLYNNKILIEQWVSADDKNSEVNIIQLDQPDLGMPSRDYYLKGRNDKTVQEYEKFAREVAALFGANKGIAERDISLMIDLETEIANITIPQDQRRDNEKLYNRMTVKQLSEKIPGFDWLRYLQTIFKNVNITVNETEEVVVYAPDYLENMVKIINKTEKRVLANYLFWRIMMNRVTNLPDQFRNIRKPYHKTIFGHETERSRWRDCVDYVIDNVGNAVGRLFVEKHFDEDAKSIALEMIHNIRESFYQLLEDADWMDEKTRIVAKEKAESIDEKIGYPEYILNNTLLDEEYTDVQFYPHKYFENVMANIRSIAINNLKKLRDPVDKTKWSTTPVIVNAFYSSTKNQIMFPAGILQPPFYNKDYPKSLNYGGIGMVIGHEITHGFDDRGRQFDKDGNLIQWWDDEVIDSFKNQAQCIVDQYGNYTVPGVNLQVNGVQTQGENIADNGGLKEAYMAYQKMVHHNEIEKRVHLPGIEHLNNYQLFFLNFAQVWCGTMRPEATVSRIRIGVHSPGRFRVVGTLQNMPEFAEAFKCSNTSYMNPQKKCRVW